MAFVAAQGVWAVDSTTHLVPEPSEASSAWGSLGLWAVIAAVALLGALFAAKMLKSRNGGASATRMDGESPRIPSADVQAAAPRGYSSKNVGNDASARPWEREGATLDTGTAAGSQGGYSGDEWPLEDPALNAPDGFDAEAFLTASKTHFVDLQAAWDRSDVSSLRAMMTDGMLAQIKSQLAEREKSSDGAVRAPSEVVMLNARLLGIEEQGEDFIASVEFSGLMHEGSSAGPRPFHELWNITHPKEGSGGWLVAGVQALQ